MPFWEKRKKWQKVAILVFSILAISYFMSEAFIALHNLANKWSHNELHLVYFFVAMSSTSIILGLIFKFKEYQKRISDELMQDGLTTLHNGRFLEKKSAEELRMALRHNDYACLCYMDINNFKQINDTIGHSGGNRALKTFSNDIKKSFRRSSDVIARMHGDEFAIFWISKNPEEAENFFQEIKKRTSDMDFEWRGKFIDMSAAAGFACERVTEDNIKGLLAKLIEIADSKMYEAKKDQR